MNEKKIVLKDLIQAAGKQLRQEFEEIRQNNPHAGESGAELELILKKFLDDRLPKRFGVETGIVVGSDGSVSRQTDLIVFDALNSPVYRRGPKTYILPRDNVAGIIEVKAKLNKGELEDAAKKIASVKALKASPITNADQPVNFSNTIITNSIGIVFAFDSYTTLQTLAENIKEINHNYESRQWIDLVVILDKGIIAYTLQPMLENNMPAYYAGTTTEDVMIPPYYFHLVKQDAGDLALNYFFLRLVSHLAFFRRRTAISFAETLGSDQPEVMTIEGYQFNLAGLLVPAASRYKVGTFKNPATRFNLYARKDRMLIGQVCYWPWQDGAVITVSVRSLNPNAVFAHYFSGITGRLGTFPPGQNAKIQIWCSSVLPMTEENFIERSHAINKNLVAVRDTATDDPPQVKLSRAELKAKKYIAGSYKD